MLVLFIGCRQIPAELQRGADAADVAVRAGENDKHEGDAPVETCTIITTDANKLMEPIHDRMPVILPPDAYDLWLDVAVQQPSD